MALLLETPTVDSVVRSVALEMGEDGGDRETHEVFSQWLSDAFQELSMEHSWTWLHAEHRLVLEAGVDAYPLPEEMGSVRLIVAPDGRTLREREIRWLAENAPELIGGSGSPAYWYRSALVPFTGAIVITLVPTPEEASELLVYGELGAEALVSSDTLPIPRQFIGPLRALMRAYYYESVDAAQLASNARSLALRQLNKLARRFVESPSLRRGFGVVPARSPNGVVAVRP